MYTLGKDAELSAPRSIFFLRRPPCFVFVAQIRFRTFIILPVSARKTKHAAKLAAKNFGQKAVAERRAPCLPPNVESSDCYYYSYSSAPLGSLTRE